MAICKTYHDRYSQSPSCAFHAADQTFRVTRHLAARKRHRLAYSGALANNRAICDSHHCEGMAYLFHIARCSAQSADTRAVPSSTSSLVALAGRWVRLPPTADLERETGTLSPDLPVNRRTNARVISRLHLHTNDPDCARPPWQVR